MFDVGFSELVVIAIVALVVLGPKRLQEVARTTGRWTARLRRFVEDVKRDVDREMRQEDLAELRKVQQEIGETRQLFEQTASSTLAALPEIKPPEPAPDYPVKALPDAAGSAPQKKKARRAATVKKKTPTAPRAKHGRATRKPR